MPVVVPYYCRTIQSCVRGGRRIVEDMCQWCDCNFGRQTFAANGSSSEAVAMLHRAPPQWRGVSSLYSAMSTCWLTAEGRTNRRCPGDAVVCEQNTKSPACTTHPGPRSGSTSHSTHTLSHAKARDVSLVLSSMKTITEDQEYNPKQTPKPRT